MEKLSADPLLHFPCPGCKAQLYFKPGSQQLSCDYCGTNVKIENGSGALIEHDLRDHLSTESDPTAAIEQKIYKCTHCGSESSFNSETPTFVCSFCKFEVVNPVAYKTRSIQPSAIIPFKIDKEESNSIFKKWLSKGRWLPKDIDQVRLMEDLHGVYLPFWTYDAQTTSEWSGYGGEYYYVTVEDEDSNGKKTTRRERRTEWIYRSGTYEHFFDDILVGGSNEIPSSAYSNVFPYQLEDLVSYNDSYLSGFKADVYDVSVNAGYAEAESLMEGAISRECADLCTIDTYRDLEVNTSYNNETYKHILLPLWICSYVYKEKTYNFLINGQTGMIWGNKPQSLAKKLRVALVILVILVIFYCIGKYAPR